MRDDQLAGAHQFHPQKIVAEKLPGPIKTFSHPNLEPKGTGVSHRMTLNTLSPGLPNVHPHSEDPTAARRMVQRPSVDSASSVLPFRPPKSPSSLITPHVPPKSPPHLRKSNILPHGLPTDKHKREADPSKALSPTSVVDSRGVFRERQRKSERRREGPGKPPSESDRSLVEAGNACMKQGNQVGAIFAHELLLEERIRRHGPEHAVVGAALNDLGMVHLHFREYKQAEKCFARAAAIQNRAKQAHPLDVVASLVNLGKARLLLHKCHAARTVFRDAIRIIRTKLGYDHIRVAEIQSQIGYLLFEAGDLPSALNAFAGALEVYRSLLISDEMNTLFKVAVSETLCNIGSIHLEQKNFDPAIDCFLEALQSQRETVGDFHPMVIVTLDNLAFVHTKKRDYEKALKYYNETLQAQVAFYGEYNHECSETKRKEQLVFKKYCSSRRARGRAMTA